MGEERRIFEYFVVAGLPESPEELTPGAQECGFKNTDPLPPITDICVIFPSLGEQVPENFVPIETTPTGHVADLNHGSLRTQSCQLCYRRGYHKPPLVDIGVLYESRGERVIVDSQVLKTTPFGRQANVNNASQGIYLTYRRAAETAHPNLLAVTDICVILTNKGETPPHTFYKINKNLNKGMVGSDVFICYKKSMANCKRIAYKPAILDRFPLEDYSDYPLPSNVPIFGLPMGALLECWPVKCQAPGRQFLTFVLTDHKGHKLYGAAVMFYEAYDRPLSQEQLEKLGATSDLQQRVGTCSDSSSTNDPAETMTFHANKCICVVSRYPFFMAFRRFLFYLHRMSTTGEYPLPIERYISHLLYEVPFPTSRRPRILVQIGNETICFDNPEDSPLPLSGASFIDFVKLLGAEHCMYLMLLALTEQKILIHSLRPWHLTSVAEAMCSLLFPFHWQCPYIPQCPLDLAGVLHAPLPFIAGVDSRYFELYEDPPKDVTCVDLDTNTISQSDIRQKIKLSLLPRKAAKTLRQQLEALEAKVAQAEFHIGNRQGFLTVELDLQNMKRRRNLELEIQEAFLRFMVQILKGYQQYLKPIRSAPSAGATDLESLFDVHGFLRTRDKSGLDFFKLMTNTQLFIRFIEERSLLSDKDKNAYLAFFDDCMARVDVSASGDHLESAKLLEYEYSSAADCFAFSPPPEPESCDKKYTYNRTFPKLELENFGLDWLSSESCRLKTPKHFSTHDIPTSAARRTKQEAKTALKFAKQQKTLSPLAWAKCVLSYTYSLWFTHLPALAKASSSKQRVLRDAYKVLDRMQCTNLGTMLDEVCYRILIHVCGVLGQPVMAVKVFLDMKRQGIQPNAITYGFYNRAVLEAQWPSTTTLSAQKYWTKIRISVRAIALLKRALREKQQRARRTLSQYSAESGEFMSQTSFGSQTMKKSSFDVLSEATAGGNESMGTYNDHTARDDKTADQGYHSQATEDWTSVSTDLTHHWDSSGNKTGSGRYNGNKLNEWNLAAFDELYKKGRAIVTQRPLRSSLLSFDSAAGLLMSSDLSKLDDSVFTDGSSSEGRNVRSKRFRNRSLIETLNGKAKTGTPKFCYSLSEPNGSQGDVGEFAKNNGKDEEMEKTNLNDSQPGKNDSMGNQQQEQLCDRKNMPLGNIPEEAQFEPDEDSSISENSSHFDLRRSHSRSPTKAIRTAVTDSSHPLGPLGPLGQEEQSKENEQQDQERSPSKENAQKLLEKQPFEGELRRSESPKTPADESGGGSFLGLSSFGRSSMRGLWSKLNNVTPITRLSKSQTMDSNFQTPPRAGSVPVSSLDSSTVSEDTMAGQNPVGALSPTLSHFVTQGAKMISKVDAFQKKSESFNRFKAGVSNVVKSFKGNLEQQLGSPIRGSWSSLSLGDAAAMGYAPFPISLAGEDCASLSNDDGAFVGGLWLNQPNDDTSSINTATGFPSAMDFDSDPAFQLSSGETGSLLGYEFVTGGENSAVNGASDVPGIEVLLCTTSRCEQCSAFLYDEEIMAGWSADDSEMNTQCPFCGDKRVPTLTVVVRRQRSSAQESWYSKTSSLGRRNKGQFRNPTPAWSSIPRRSSFTSTCGKTEDDSGMAGSVEPLPATPSSESSSRAESTPPSLTRCRAGSDADKNLLKEAVNRRLFLDLLSSPNPTADRDGTKSNSNDGEVYSTMTVPYLSPFVLRKEVETVLSSDGDEALTQTAFIRTHPILYWNLLYIFRRLSVPTHFMNWLSAEYADKFGSPSTATSQDSNSPPSAPNEIQVSVRCVYDTVLLHKQQRGSLTSTDSGNSVDNGASGVAAVCKPIYLTAQMHTTNEHAQSPLMNALLIDDHYLVSRAVVAQIIDYLSVPNLHKPLMVLINEHRKRSVVKSNSGAGRQHHLPKHFSIYRDILFLALAHFGHGVRRDDFDREYALALGKLPPVIAAKLAPDDRQPSIMVKACRKIFIPLDLC